MGALLEAPVWDLVGGPVRWVDEVAERREDILMAGGDEGRQWYELRLRRKVGESSARNILSYNSSSDSLWV